MEMQAERERLAAEAAAARAADEARAGRFHLLGSVHIG
jgi:hypothetical protein